MSPGPAGPEGETRRGRRATKPRGRRGDGGDPVEVGAALRGVLSDLDLDVAALGIRIHECWPAVVGEEVARHASPAVLRGPVLEVQVDSSVWCQQLALRQEEILAGLKQALGDQAPTDLRLRLG